VDPALWELLRAEADADGDRVLEAIIRLARPGIEVPDVRIVARFGTIATCRIRARDVIAVRARTDVISLKAARGLSPGFEPAFDLDDSAGPAPPCIRPTDIRRPTGLGLTGEGVVVATVDWGVDVQSAALRWPDDPAAAGTHRPGGTRFLAFWDQRDHATGPRPDPYGYGSVHDRAEIDRALQDPRPYERLGYHPAIADPKGRGSHGHRTIDIAAGNGRAGGPMGIAPDADLIFVHLADRNTGGIAPFGDDARLLEAVHFISRTAGSQPCAINISAGRICGPHNGTALAELAFDELLATTPGRFICNSAGNYRRRRAHACGTIAAGEARSLTVAVDPADITLNEIEIWYDGADEFAVRISPPGYTAGRPVSLGERSELLVEGQVIGRVYHRKHDPNNGDNHIVAYLDPIGRAGNWTVTLEARRVTSGRFHAWIERDDSCPGCQARFTPKDSNTATTIGSITTSHLPLIVGAYDGHDPARHAAPFSSRGPTSDSRPKPDLVAPGVDVLAGRSAPVGASANPGTLVRGRGTSFATPHVTGAVALCFEAAARLSAHAIRSLVLDSCDPAPDSDRYSFGRGYLNISRLGADVQQAVAPQTPAPSPKEPTMDAEDTIMLLAAAPATAYREYLYRPRGQLARWISSQFDIVARPGQPIAAPVREGDILLEVTLGRISPGRCATLSAPDVEHVATRPTLPQGRLILRPRKRLEMSEPFPVEPNISTLAAAGTDLELFRQDPPENQLTDVLSPPTPIAGNDIAAPGDSVPAADRTGTDSAFLQFRERLENSEPLPVEPARGVADPELGFRVGCRTSFCQAADGARPPLESESDVTSETPSQAESEAAPGSPSVVPGQLVAEHVPLLSAHVGTPPDMVLTWNSMPPRSSVDVVVHLHGFSTHGRWMQLPTDMLPVSGLDFADPADRSSVGRTKPTLLVLPRGNYFGGRSGRGYNFPALHPREALRALVNDALGRFAADTGARPGPGQLILTAHSGGGAALMRILRYADPDEVHTFDALYTDPAPLIAWARHRIAEGTGAMRVLYRPHEATAQQSLAVAAAIHDAFAAAGHGRSPRWRVESTRVPHTEIPVRYGWRLLADVAADLPAVGAALATPGHHGEALQDEGAAEAAELAETAEFEEAKELADTEAAYWEEHSAFETAWSEYQCAEQYMVAIHMLGHRALVNPIAAAAFAALAEELQETGYQAEQVLAYNCRDIEHAELEFSRSPSLHAYGLAVDIDPQWNPHDAHVSGPIQFSTQFSQAGRQQEVAAGAAGTIFTPEQVAAVEAIRTVDGMQVFGWGGKWQWSHDAMHFEIRLMPAELQRGLAPRLAAGWPDRPILRSEPDVAGNTSGARYASESGERNPASDPRWSLYDQLPHAWGQGEADHD
jgi:subtilisin family serine protease